MYKGILAGTFASAFLYSSLFGVASATSLPPSPSCTISVPPGVHYAGQSIRVLWVTENASSAHISSLGQVPANQLRQGYRDIPLTTNALLTMTVTNASGSKTCSVLITATKVPTQTQTVYQQVPVTQTRTVYQPVTQYAPTTNTSSWSPLTNVWTPFYSTPNSSYGSLYTPGSGNSYYYAGDTYNDYLSFYDSPYIGGSASDGYYYLSNPSDCYYYGDCGQTGLPTTQYDWGTYSEQAARGDYGSTWYGDGYTDYYAVQSGNTVGNATYDCPGGYDGNCYLEGYGYNVPYQNNVQDGVDGWHTWTPDELDQGFTNF